MNFLAHAYLSFRQPEILVGNLISDFVKGKKKYDYPPSIVKGINLHRSIDTYTDEHPVNARAKQVFKPAVGLYASAFLDVVYDHFLATDELAFPANSLEEFTGWVYGTLDGQAVYFPDKFGQMFPYMKQQNWLLNYREKWGIRKSMEGLVRRAQYLDQADAAYEAFEANYDLLKTCYERFFPDLLWFATEHFKKDLTIPPGTL